MAILTSPGPYLSLFAGLASYLLYFHHGERHLHPFNILQFHLLILAIITVARQQYLSEPLRVALSTSSTYFLLYLLSLWTSTILYRLFLNPLNTLAPTPYFGRLSKFNHVFQNVTLKSHQKLLELHRKQGHYVRLGPNDISCTDPAAVAVISGPNSKCSKATWYSNDVPLVSMHTTRDRAQHDLRRRVWAPAFGNRALRGYEARMKRFSDLLIEGLANGKFLGAKGSQGKGEGAVNASEVFNWYSFDVMGDLAFGKDFGCLEGGETHWAIQLLNEGMKPAGLGLPAWFFRVVIAIPGAAKDYWRFISFCSNQLAQRMSQQSAREKSLSAPNSTDEKDITHFLIAHYDAMSPSDQRKALPMLQGDSRLIIVAGSDTTAATLVHVFYWLSKKPELVKELRREIEGCRNEDGKGFSDLKLSEKGQVLNGVIMEALRLNPPVPSGIFRKTPAEGVWIGEKFIPGNTTIQMPWYAMAYDDKNYANPTAFLPERWTPKGSNLIHEKDAFQSFSSGPYGCIGKNLALMELRTVTAALLDKFDISFAKGEDGRELLEETIDHFTLGLGGLWLKFEERK